MARRLIRLVFGLLLCGTGVSLMINADLGLAPWDVLHQGIAKHTSLGIGTVAIIVGFVVLLLWLPLKERYGVGTLFNVVLIGLTIDVLLAVLPDDLPLGVRIGFLLVGTFLFGPGSGYYIGVGMGAGPRDGLMTALAARGYSVRVVRTVLEVSVLAIGFALGGGVGIGTLLFAFTIGPNVHFWLERLSLEHPEPETVIGAE
ncbi:MAG: hypothetical protein QOI95_586 [Acidimicrobiaceae bacterium]|jgi:uncharacterized membrane protein YczE